MSVKAMFFPVVMYVLERWTINKAESQRIEAFKLWSWRRLLRVPWTAGRWNQSIHQEMNLDYSLERLMLKLRSKTWPPDVKRQVIGKDPMLGKIEGRKRGRERMVGWHHWLNGHEFEWTPGVGDGQGGLACCDSWGCKDSDTTERLNWTELNSEDDLYFAFLWI